MTSGEQSHHSKAVGASHRAQFHQALSAGLEQAASGALPGIGHRVPHRLQFGENLSCVTAVT